MKRNYLFYSAVMIMTLAVHPLFALHAVQSVQSIGSRSDTAVAISAAGTGTNGRSDEYAYSEGKTLSRIEWGMTPLAQAALSLECLLPCSADIGMTVRAAFPSNTGHVKDTDYENLNSVPTKFSQHRCRTERALFADLFAAKCFTFDSVKLMIFPGVLFSSTKLSAHDGFTQYPAGSTKIPVSGKIMSLEQTIVIPYAGIRGAYRLSENYTVSAAAYASMITLGRTTDRHYKTDTTYHDSTAFGPYAALQLAAAWSFNERISSFIAADLSGIFGSKGSSYSVNRLSGARSRTSDNAAGISTREASISAGMTALFSL